MRMSRWRKQLRAIRFEIPMWGAEKQKSKFVPRKKITNCWRRLEVATLPRLICIAAITQTSLAFVCVISSKHVRLVSPSTPQSTPQEPVVTGTKISASRATPLAQRPPLLLKSSVFHQRSWFIIYSIRKVLRTHYPARSLPQRMASPNAAMHARTEARRMLVPRYAKGCRCSSDGPDSYARQSINCNEGIAVLFVGAHITTGVLRPSKQAKPQYVQHSTFCESQRALE